MPTQEALSRVEVEVEAKQPGSAQNVGWGARVPSFATTAPQAGPQLFASTRSSQVATPLDADKGAASAGSTSGAATTSDTQARVQPAAT
eukprot:4326381-Prymnesium_polylepis.1